MGRGHEMSRYARQIAVPEFGPEAQKRLAGASALIIGAGGLAAPVLQYLTGAGLGRIRLADPDRVERSNLHRQTIFREADEARPKAAAAAAHMAALNGDTEIEAHETALDPDNAAELLAGMDIAIDCADSFAASYILSDICFERGAPLISASAIGTSGYVAGFCGGAPSLRAVFPDLPARAGTCASEGVIGPLLAVIGGLQAQMALSLLAGLSPSPLGRMISYDALLLRFGGFDFGKAPEPDASPRFISPAAISDGDFVADLRGADEAPLIRAGALRLKADEFGPGGPVPASGQRAVLCCRSGIRAWTAANRLSSIWPGEIALIAAGDVTKD